VVEDRSREARRRTRLARGCRRRPWRGFIGSVGTDKASCGDRWRRRQVGQGRGCFIPKPCTPSTPMNEAFVYFFLYLERHGSTYVSRRILLRGFSLFRVGKRRCDELNIFNGKLVKTCHVTSVGY
jgi:hypothetical protein